MLLVTLSLVLFAIVVVLIATYPFSTSQFESVDQLTPNGLLGSNCIEGDWNLELPMKCQIGGRGPCDEGQVFSAIPADADYNWMDIGRKTCFSDIAKGCLKATEDPEEDDEPLSSVKSRHGVCLWNDENNPCDGQPGEYRFSAHRKQCYLADVFKDLGCEAEQIFTALNETHGECQCLEDNQVIWPGDGRCYELNSQGPCEDKHWLVKDEGELACRMTQCPTDGKHVEWSTDDERLFCYLLGEQGPCEEGAILQRHKFQIACSGQHEKRILHPLVPCQRGFALARNGRCRSVFAKMNR